MSGVKDHTLVPLKFIPLPVSSIKPLGKLQTPRTHIICLYTTRCLLVFHVGWLKQQLQVQAAGLSGHLPLFWPDVENSSWVGGTADTGLHERTPYWLNGFVPLAFQLEDPDLISLVSHSVSMCNHQVLIMYGLGS